MGSSVTANNDTSRNNQRRIMDDRWADVVKMSDFSAVEMILDKKKGKSVEQIRWIEQVACDLRTLRSLRGWTE